MSVAIEHVEDLATLTSRAAELWPDRIAWVFDGTGQRYSYADVHRDSTALAAGLTAYGVAPGDRVAAMLRNEPDFPLLWLALARLGAVLVPVNTNYRELDAAHVLDDSGARLVVAADEFTELLRGITGLRHAPEVIRPRDLYTTRQHGLPAGPAPEQPVNIQYTSGTTGSPKGCVLPHRYWTTIARSMVEESPHLTPDDITLTAQPFHYIDPQWNVVTGLTSGARLVVLDRFHPSTFWQKVRQHGVTWFYCLGLMPTALLRQPAAENDRDHSVRAIHASAVPPELHAELERRWGVPWFEAFGMTETGADLRVREHEHDELVGTGCVGTPIRDREVMILDSHGGAAPRGRTGELAIRGTGLMLGYHGRPEVTAHAFRDGWFHTGDLARMDEAGRVYYVGRTKDMIRRSGENISADEVEHALTLHPDVDIAAVTAVPDDLRGEEIQAHIVLAEGAAGPDPESLALFCAAKLAYFKVPRYWRFADKLPMTPSERVAKGQLAGGDEPWVGSYDRGKQRWW
ncbi:AMP-binding protein [Haloechinothrix sp. YIM 98757]|uniref:AMP-binding protein n=1 Tax=Haloechinothrix aidingensis TaxID=2752311 RepID=A0A838ACV3_9PSEU|nr:AMP-binding protein [Haloechinothrix aidingensis]